MSRRIQRGFTIVELLVVITIIGILMALLFPAINAAIRSARRAQCINNQRQVATAVITTTTAASGNFPKHLASLGSVTTVPWTVRILPSLGRQDVYDAYVGGGSPSVRIDVFMCPSDPPAIANEAQLSYAGNAGQTGVDDGIAHGIFFKTLDQSLGYVAQNDGVATTLLLGENVHATTWHDTGSDEYRTCIIYSDQSGPMSSKIDLASTASLKTIPSSRHPGGFVVAFCDNHTRFLSSEIDHNVYELIMTPNGDQATPVQANGALNEGDLK